MSAVLEALPDLEEMAWAAQEPEYVLAFMPSFLCASIWRRLSEPSYWELFTVAEYESGSPCRDDWRTEGYEDTYPVLLAAWVKSKLGFPVALEPDATGIRAERRCSRWHRVPLYWVLRNT